MTTNKPLIGLVPDFKDGNQENGYSIRPYYALRRNYIDMINKAGAAVILLPYDYEAIDQYLSMIDGLVIVGGHFDIHPKRYSESTIHPTTTLNETRENFEFALASQALQQNKLPILGICNGMQLISVYHGGKIIQHIPEAGDYLNHEQSKSKIPDSSKPYHQVNIDPSSKLYRIIAEEKIQTNSSHHQAVRSVEHPLKISAYATDGIIEAVENPLHPFCIGVQWHPEFDVSQADRKLFKHFVEACQKNQK